MSSQHDHLFYGFYGFKNVGDDIFCLVADWGASRYWSSKSNTFIGQHLPKLSDSAKAVYPLKRSYPGEWTANLYRSAALADRLVYFGGSTLHSSQPHWTNLFTAKPLQKLAGKRMAAVGVSIGPFKTVADEISIRKHLQRASFIAVRDKASYEIAQGMDLHVPVIHAFDPALLLLRAAEDYGFTMPQRPLPSSSPVIGVSVCHAERHVGGDLQRERDRVAWVSLVLKQLLAQGAKLKFFVFNGHEEYGDQEVTNALIAELGRPESCSVTPYNPDTLTFISSMHDCHAFFGTRLHGSITSYACGIPFLLVEYHRKCSDFLDEVGFPNAFRVGDGECNPSYAADTVLSLASQQGSALHQLSVPEAELAAMRNFECPWT